MQIITLDGEKDVSQSKIDSAVKNATVPGYAAAVYDVIIGAEVTLKDYDQSPAGLRLVQPQLSKTI